MQQQKTGPPKTCCTSKCGKILVKIPTRRNLFTAIFLTKIFSATNVHSKYHRKLPLNIISDTNDTIGLDVLICISFPLRNSRESTVTTAVPIYLQRW